MTETSDMVAAALKKVVQPSLLDNLSDSGFTNEQAAVLERAVANLHNFIPSYWLQEFANAGFSKDQASLIVDLFTRRASRGQ